MMIKKTGIAFIGACLFSNNQPNQDSQQKSRAAYEPVVNGVLLYGLAADMADHHFFLDPLNRLHHIEDHGARFRVDAGGEVLHLRVQNFSKLYKPLRVGRGGTLLPLADSFASSAWEMFFSFLSAVIRSPIFITIQLISMSTIGCIRSYNEYFGREDEVSFLSPAGRWDWPQQRFSAPWTQCGCRFGWCSGFRDPAHPGRS